MCIMSKVNKNFSLSLEVEEIIHRFNKDLHLERSTIISALVKGLPGILEQMRIDHPDMGDVDIYIQMSRYLRMKAK